MNLHFIFFDVRIKLNNHILQYSDLKCAYEIKPSQIDFHILHSFNVLFSKSNQFLNNICIAIIFYDAPCTYTCMHAHL